MRLLTATAALLLACGCTTPGPTPPASTPSAMQPGCERVDCERMARVERAARARGVSVHWVHPPQRKTPPTAITAEVDEDES
jgi:hypothetical protein